MQDPFKPLDVASGIKFPDQGSNPSPLHWEYGILATGSPEKFPPSNFFFPPSNFKGYVYEGNFSVKLIFPMHFNYLNFLLKTGKIQIEETLNKIWN